MDFICVGSFAAGFGLKDFRGNIPGDLGLKETEKCVESAWTAKSAWKSAWSAKSA